MPNRKGKDWTRDLDSIRRQNIKLLKEREDYRDTVRDLRTKERNYQERLEELWAICTDVRVILAQVRDVSEDDNWANLPKEVRSLVEDYVLDSKHLSQISEQPESLEPKKAFWKMFRSG